VTVWTFNSGLAKEQEMIFGDVFSIVMAVVAIFLTGWATMIAMALLCPGAAERARKAALEPKKALVRGLMLLLTVGLLGVVFIAIPNPLTKFVGWVLVLGLLTISSVGTAGISLNASRRLQDMDPTMPAYGAFVRSSAYVAGATILPLVGWFFIAPLLLIASIGSGWKAVMHVPGRVGAQEAA